MNRLTLTYVWKQKQIPSCCAGPDAVIFPPSCPLSGERLARRLSHFAIFSNFLLSTTENRDILPIWWRIF